MCCLLGYFKSSERQNCLQRRAETRPGIPKSWHACSEKAPGKLNSCGHSRRCPGWPRPRPRELKEAPQHLPDPDPLPQGQLLPCSPQSGASHAAAGRDLAAVAEPGHLRPGEAGDARGADDGGFSVGDALVLLALLKAAHVCRERGRRDQALKSPRGRPGVMGGSTSRGGAPRKGTTRQGTAGLEPLACIRRPPSNSSVRCALLDASGFYTR